jgi:regulator of protease activity HflC (stomatin/prohibitin superfamily)
MPYIIVAIVVVALIIILIPGPIRTVRPVERGLVERFGRYARFGNPGIIFLIPYVEKLVRVNITEQMVSSEKREIITADSLNAVVDSNVYFKVKIDEDNVKASIYSVNNYKIQIVALAQTTLRNIIGTMTLKEANSERNKINSALFQQLSKETSSWGIEIVRTELKEIQPPEKVQETMNSVVIAANQKIAAQDFATAVETKADGEKRGAIKQAEGQKQSKILIAEGEAQAIKIVNEAANAYFIGNAQLLRRLETVEKALSSNTKIVLPEGQSLVNVIGNLAGINTK